MPTATRLFDGTKILGDITGLSVTIEVHQCGTCGVIFGFDESFADARRSDKASWYCPNGHSFSWRGKPEVYELREEAERLRDSLARERARRDQAEASARAQRGAATRARNERDRLKTRAAAGVCPCCSRTFKQLAAHMRSQHPGFVEEAAGA